MPVREVLARTSAAELTEWAAYERMTGPLDQGYRADVLAGVVASTVANAMRGKGRALRHTDFMPEWGGRKAQGWQQQLMMVQQMNRALGGADRRTNR